MEKHSLLIFGGGPLQTSIINIANKKNFRTIVLDPDETALGKELADHFFVVGGSDFEKTLSIAKEYNVKGIVTAATDKPLLMMARIANVLKLPFPTIQAVLNSTRKDLMKACFIKHGVPCAKGILVTENDIIDENLINKIKFPLVVKPIDSSGSRGVTVNYTLNQLKDSIKLAKSFSKEKMIIIEEFVEGTEVSVESIVYNNKTIILQVTDKVTTNPPFNVELGQIQPSYLSDSTREQIHELTSNTVKALGLNDCACHTEIKITSKGPVIIENGARLGGDFITSMLVPLSTGIDMEGALIDISTGIKPEPCACLSNGAVIKYLELPLGRIQHVDDWQGIFELSNIIRADLSLNKGEQVRQITNSLDRYGYVITNGNNRENAIKNAEKGIEFLKSKVNVV
jgi:biotin carboxylase